MNVLAVAIFAASLAVLLWIHLGYPLAVALRARLRPRPVVADPAWRPALSVIIAARDEADGLDAKLASLLGQGWPEELLEVIVVDDGSADVAARLAVAAASGERGVHLVRHERPLGRALALDHGVAQASGEVLVFTDARTRLAPGALAALVAPLGDQAVGAVSGELVSADPRTAADPEGRRARRERVARLRRGEAASGSAVDMSEALWAMRRSLWTPLPAGTPRAALYEALWTARQGRRVVTAHGARALDPAGRAAMYGLSPEVERTLGLLTLVHRLPWLVSPRRNPLFFGFASRELARLGAPLALLGLLATSLVLAWEHPVFSFALAAQIVLYALGALVAPPTERGPLVRLIERARGFVLEHAATGLGLWRFFHRRARRRLDEEADSLAPQAGDATGTTAGVRAPSPAPSVSAWEVRP